jgi:hypothetical protein
MELTVLQRSHQRRRVPFRIPLRHAEFPHFSRTLELLHHRAILLGVTAFLSVVN